MQFQEEKSKVRGYLDLLEKCINLNRVALVIARQIDQNRKKNDTKWKIQK